jgi:patatin-like phospholipase/acyl hydrolase
MKKLLNIDGGGVRVYFPLLILDYIEQKTGKKIIDLFDYYSGVSSSSILLSGLLTKYSVKELIKLFKELSKSIFYRSYYYIIKSGFGLFNSKYTDYYINQELKKLFQDLKLSDVKKPLTILSYDLHTSKPIYYDTYSKKESLDSLIDHNLWEVVRGSTAAPTYFPPYNLGSHLLIDGGVVTNNLSELIYSKANTYFEEKENFFQLSIGTGCYKPKMKSKPSGLLSWSNLLDISFNASSSFEENEFKTLSLNNVKYFHRLEINLDNDIILDDYNSFNQMDQIFNKWLEKNQNNLDKICDELI